MPINDLSHVLVKSFKNTHKFFHKTNYYKLRATHATKEKLNETINSPDI